MNHGKLNPHDERRVAVKAGCDPRTVRAYLAGKSVRSTVAARVSEALRDLGLAPSPEKTS
jgi:DNA-binding LacI/PurR family transcriptional regulator